MKYTLVLVLTVLAFCRCGRDVDCADSSISPEFSGYTFSDIDTMVLRKYKAADAFNTLIDTFLLTSANCTYEMLTGGNFLVYIRAGANGSNGSPKGTIQTGYDWQLYIPSAGRTVAITGIVSEHKGQHCWRCVCYNRVFSFVADTLTYKFTDPATYTFLVHR